MEVRSALTLTLTVLSFVLPFVDFLGQLGRIPRRVDVLQVVGNPPSEGVFFLGENPAQRAVRPSRHRSPSRSRAFGLVAIAIGIGIVIDVAISRGSGNPSPRVRSEDYGIGGVTSTVAFMVDVCGSGSFRVRVHVRVRAAYPLGGFVLGSFALFGSRRCHGT